MTQDTERELAAIARSTYWTEAEGRTAVAAWRASGESAARFGAQHGLSTRRLRWWGHRLGKIRTRATTTGNSAVELVPIRVIQRENGDEPIEIGIGEFKIRVRRGADPETLRTVVEVLRSC